MDKTPIKSLPLLIRKSAIIKYNSPSTDAQLNSNVKVASLFREDVIHDTTDVYYLKGEFQRLILVNRMNVVTKVSRTIAKYTTKSGSVFEKTSDSVTQAIGPDQYKTVFTGLCSIIDQELRIRSLLALLTAATQDFKLESKSPDLKKDNCEIKKDTKDVSCQTYETRIEKKKKPRKRVRRPVEPYIVKYSDASGQINDEPAFVANTTPVINNSVVQKNSIYTNTSNVSSPNVYNSSCDVKNLDTHTSRYNVDSRPLNVIVSENLDSENKKEQPISNRASIILHKNLPSSRHVACNNDLINASPITINPASTNTVVNSTDILNNCTITNDSKATSVLNEVTEDVDTFENIDTHNIDLPDLGHLHNDHSNDSLGSFSFLLDTPSVLLTNPTSILNNVDQHTKIEQQAIDSNRFDSKERFKITVDGMDIVLPYEPEDVFHIATKENLEYMDNKCKLKVLEHQMRIDFKHCLTVLDDDGNLPIHMAVLNDDLELLKRQCIVLKMRQVSVDIPAKGVTPLEHALHQLPASSAALCSCLIRAGASPFRAGDGHRTAAHVAAERDPNTLRAIVGACIDNARSILKQTEGLWSPEMESKPDEELVKFLMKRLCSLFDQQGYTPLMLASMLGKYENVALLLEHSPMSVNDKMPTSGNTALFLTVAATWKHSAECGDKSKVQPHYRKTIETLLDYSADPSIDNHSGVNVNVLLTEFNCPDLSLIISNRRVMTNIIKIKGQEKIKQYDNLMLVKDSGGNVVFQKLQDEHRKRAFPIQRHVSVVNKEIENNSVPGDKPVIVKNILLKSPGSGNVSKRSEKSKASAGKSSIKTVDESIKVSTLKEIVITGKSSPVEKKRVVMQTPKYNILKRKVIDVPKMMKMAKREK